MINSIARSAALSIPGLPAMLHAADEEAGKRLVEPGLGSGQLLDTLGGLLVVLVIIGGLAWLVKRYVQVPGLNKGAIRIIGGVSLGPREKAVLVSVDGVRLLLGVAPGRVQTLCRLDGEADVEPDDSGEAGSDFGQVLADAGGDSR